MSLAETRRMVAQFNSSKPTIGLDLDGTLCPHEWIDEETIVDPFPEALNFVANLSSKYNVVIFSARATRQKGKIAIREWIVKHGMSQYIMDITNQKLYSFLVYIDDRAITFRQPSDYNNILKELGVDA